MFLIVSIWNCFSSIPDINLSPGGEGVLFVFAPLLFRLSSANYRALADYSAIGANGLRDVDSGKNDKTK
jgi:hypothetical protein